MGKKLREVESNKYRGGTSDATTPSSLTVPLIIMLWTTFFPQKQPYSSFENNTGHTDGPTDGPTDGRTDGRTRPLIEMRSRI